MRQTRQAGFTLIELLVVIAIVGILSAITFSLGFQQVRQGQLNATKGEMIESIEKVRTSVIRSGKNGVITFNDADSATQYSLQYSADGKTISDTGLIDIPRNVTVDISGGNTATYAAPYGELQPTNRTVTLQLGDQKTTFYLVGITGKVVE